MKRLAISAVPRGQRVLDISHATVAGDDQRHAYIMRGNLHVDAGELVLVHVVDVRQAELWADAAVGILSPLEGRVSVLGNDLTQLDVETGCWLRGRIGRVFGRGNWIGHESLLDNILLPARYHSGRSDADLIGEASLLATAFGMPGIPLGTPDHFTRPDLQRAACIRAFLGNPMLVILEDPTDGAHASLLKPLVDAIRLSRNRGAGVLWFSPAEEVWRDRSIPVTRRYRVTGNELTEVKIH